MSARIQLKSRCLQNADADVRTGVDEADDPGILVAKRGIFGSFGATHGIRVDAEVGRERQIGTI
jgi:hypothetical protein